MPKHLTTVAEVIAELGGPKAVSELTSRGHSISLVANWKLRKKFPPQTFATLQAALRRRGFSAPNELWGMQ